ncbi:unnamed protein product, partial [Symbiodinium sp. CCMP2592]
SWIANDHQQRPKCFLKDQCKRRWEILELPKWNRITRRMPAEQPTEPAPPGEPKDLGPALADVSDTSEIESIITAALPAAIREEVSASRISGLLALLCKLFIVYGPGSLTERELGLKHIAEPPVGVGVHDTIEGLREWKRWCSRMLELGGLLPDSAIQVRALKRMTSAVMLQHPEASFRISLARAELQIDLVPDDAKVQKLHAAVLSELESMAIEAGTKPEDKGKGRTPRPPPPPKGTSEAAGQATTPAAGPDTSNQQIKAMLAEAAGSVPSQWGDRSPPPPNPKAAPQTPVQGTPVTMASLSAQLDSLRAMVGNPEVRALRVEPNLKPDVLPDEFKRQKDLRALVERCEAKVCKGLPTPPAVPNALLDSGATHAVIPYAPKLSNLERVPVTLAGDAKEEWRRTEGGTLVVPPDPSSPADCPKGQTILPLGALVEHLGCQVAWSKRQGLKVTHPTVGVLRTGVSDNTCPYLQETQALRLIAELEANRLECLKAEVENLQCRLEETTHAQDPTRALCKYAETGDRRDALAALIAQPYFKGLSEELVASLAEPIPGPDPDENKVLLKGLVEASNDPIAAWCHERGMVFLPVDILERGGRGWDLSRPNAVWRTLLWAAAAGRIAAIFSSPPKDCGRRKRLLIQDKFPWSLASAVCNTGIPYLADVDGSPPEVETSFQCWSGTRPIRISQGALGAYHERPTLVTTNLDLGFLGTLPKRGDPTTPPGGKEWTQELRREIVLALSGRPTTQSVDDLDKMISSRRASTNPLESKLPATTELEPCSAELQPHQQEEERADREDEAAVQAVHRPSNMTPEALEGWKQHIWNGHLPYRRDCKQCIEGAAICYKRRRVQHPQSFALSVDLFGPVPPSEHGRDGTCVSGRYTVKFGLVGAFRVPLSLLKSAPKEDGVTDLFQRAQEEDDLAEYEPSLPDETPDASAKPHPAGALTQDDVDFDELFRDPVDEDCPRAPPPFVLALQQGTGSGIKELGSQPSSVLHEEQLPKDPEALNALIEELRAPDPQVVLRYFMPIKGRTGAEVTLALQQMILQIMKSFPVYTLHSDMGTEFTSKSLETWLAAQGVRHQTSLPTDKKANGLAERTVGWVKSHIRTLLRSATLPTHWWPLAGRWAVEAHNRRIMGLPNLPSFGQAVLHRVKQPADGTKYLMHRWIEARYAAPHSTVPDGH